MSRGCVCVVVVGGWVGGWVGNAELSGRCAAGRLAAKRRHGGARAHVPPPTPPLSSPLLRAEHLREIFYRMGFSDDEIVALAGAHTLGRCHTDRSGWDGPWTNGEGWVGGWVGCLGWVGGGSMARVWGGGQGGHGAPGSLGRRALALRPARAAHRRAALCSCCCSPHHLQQPLLCGAYYGEGAASCCRPALLLLPALLLAACWCCARLCELGLHAARLWAAASLRAPLHSTPLSSLARAEQVAQAQVEGPSAVSGTVVAVATQCGGRGCGGTRERGGQGMTGHALACTPATTTSTLVPPPPPSLNNPRRTSPGS